MACQAQKRWDQEVKFFRYTPQQNGFRGWLLVHGDTCSRNLYFFPLFEHDKDSYGISNPSARWITTSRARVDYLRITIEHAVQESHLGLDRSHTKPARHHHPTFTMRRSLSNRRFGGLQSERTSVSSDTHSAKRERAKAEGAQERRVSSPSGLECRAALPILGASAPTQNSIFFRPPTLPFPCSAKRHCKCECTQRRSFSSGIPAALVWQSSLSCSRVPSWPWCTMIPYLRMDLLGRGTSYCVFHILCSFSPPLVSSRISFSARPLSDVPASQVPSVAAAADFLHSFSRR